MAESIDLEHTLQQALDGDDEALGNLIDYFRTQLRETIHGDLQGPMQRRLDASDVIQQACVRAMQAFHEQFQGRTINEFWGWLHSIQRRTVIDAVRYHRADKRNAHQEQSDQYQRVIPGQLTSPSEKVIRSESRQRLERALENLSEEQRKAVYLRHIQEQQIAEIAIALGKSEDAAAKLISRGIANLKRHLSGESEESK